MSLITLPSQPTTPDILRRSLPTGKDYASRVNQFIHWLKENGQAWYTAPLADYIGHLKERGLTPASINAHLSTIRKQYRRLLNDNETRASLYTLAYEQLASDGMEASPANAKAYVDEFIARIMSAIDPDSIKVKTLTIQDRPDSDHIRLTFEQSNALLSTIDRSTPSGLRDYAVIALMLATGIREAEAANLRVGDLRHKVGGELVLLVREGKGSKQRAIPYGANVGVLDVISDWLKLVGETSPTAPLFRAVNKGGKVQSEALTTRTIQRILDSYSIVIDGKAVKVKPHDLRRTYARLCWQTGMDLVAIQQNMGHASVKTTLAYIGELDTSNRAPKQTGFRFSSYIS